MRHELLERLRDQTIEYAQELKSRQEILTKDIKMKTEEKKIREEEFINKKVTVENVIIEIKEKMIEIEKVKNGALVVEDDDNSLPVSLEEYMKKEMKKEDLREFKNKQLKVF